VTDAPSLEQRIDDVRAVMDTIGSRQATLLGFSEGCAMSVVFAATHPDRVSRLILYGRDLTPVLRRPVEPAAMKRHRTF
jgi:pimeloyl-ACP methyl ester carboxylesterase